MIRQAEEGTRMEHSADDVFVGDVRRYVCCHSAPHGNETANDDGGKEERPLLG